MSATVLSSPAGTARQLQSGGWLVDIGDAFPTWRPSRESARELLDLTVSPAGPSASPVVCSPSGPARPGPISLDP